MNLNQLQDPSSAETLEGLRIHVLASRLCKIEREANLPPYLDRERPHFLER
jgi:hypothetical protein